MNLETANSNSVNEFPRCQKRTRTGRCRMSVADPSATLCPHHLRAPSRNRKPADLSATLTADLSDFTSAAPINEFLSRLLRHQAEDRITPRRAAVMAYTCNLLLRTIPAIEHETNLQNEQREWIFDMPRPKRDDPEPSDTLALIRNISSANCNPGEDPPGKKLS